MVKRNNKEILRNTTKISCFESKKFTFFCTNFLWEANIEIRYFHSTYLIYFEVKKYSNLNVFTFLISTYRKRFFSLKIKIIKNWKSNNSNSRIWCETIKNYSESSNYFHLCNIFHLSYFFHWNDFRKR